MPLRAADGGPRKNTYRAASWTMRAGIAIANAQQTSRPASKKIPAANMTSAAMAPVVAAVDRTTDKGPLLLLDVRASRRSSIIGMLATDLVNDSATM